MNQKSSFWSELQRRHVVRAAIGHMVFFWLLAQVADVVLPYIGVVDQPARWAVIGGIALFPVTLVVAWFFEHPWHRQTGSKVFVEIVVILVIATAAGSWVWKNLPEHILDRTSIVVLPFQNQDSNSLGKTISRALAYEINGLLMKSKSIDVIGIETASSELLDGLSLPQVAKRLDVLHILTGTVLMAGQQMLVNARLEDGHGNILWQDDLKGDLEELFRVQEEIAAGVTSRLGVGDDIVTIETLAARRCDMPLEAAALEGYYTARYLIELRNPTKKGIAAQYEAVKLYENIVETYPDFAEAHSGLAWALHHISGYDRRNVDAGEYNRRKMEHAGIAYGLCDSLGEALIILPNEFDHDNEWVNAEQQLLMWMDLQPEAVENQQKYTRHLTEVGRLKQAAELARKGYRLNPLSVRTIKELAFILNTKDTRDEAEALFDKAAELGAPTPNMARFMKQMDHCADDLECMLKNLPEHEKGMTDRYREIYRKPANETEAEASYAAAKALLEEQPDMVNLYSGTACDYEHTAELFFLAWEVSQSKGVFWYWPNVWQTGCKQVYSDARFAEIMESAGMVEYWREWGWPDVCRPEGESFVCG